MQAPLLRGGSRWASQTSLRSLRTLDRFSEAGMRVHLPPPHPSLLRNDAFPRQGGRYARHLGVKSYAASEASRIFTILSGFVTEPLSALEPFLILSTTSMPEVTSPMTVYLPLRN